MLIVCKECGEKVSDKAAACVHCGAPLQVFPTETPKFMCIECGEELPPNAAACAMCGCPTEAIGGEVQNPTPENPAKTEPFALKLYSFLLIFPVLFLAWPFLTSLQFGLTTPLTIGAMYVAGLLCYRVGMSVNRAALCGTLIGTALMALVVFAYVHNTRDAVGDLFTEKQRLEKAFLENEVYHFDWQEQARQLRNVDTSEAPSSLRRAWQNHAAALSDYRAEERSAIKVMSTTSHLDKLFKKWLGKERQLEIMAEVWEVSLEELKADMQRAQSNN